jgi:glycerophosphoryl diester phosphodiesterase
MEIIAHRGASHEAPENTLAAARLAWAQGADAIECDVHFARSGELVVIHDEDLRRVAGVARRVGEATLDELRGYDVGAWKGGRFAGERIPTLDEWLATIPPGKRAFIEVKTGAAAAPELARCVRRHALAPGQVVLISFQLETARAAKQVLPACTAGWILERDEHGAHPKIEDVVATVRRAGLDALDLEAEWPLDATVVQRAHAAGLAMFTWTVDDADRARELRAAGVDGVTTNLPGRLRALLGS